MKNFRDLHVWRKSHALTLSCYKVTSTFPTCELYGITSQIRRCGHRLPQTSQRLAVSEVMENFQRFLGIAAGSASELEYHFLLARDLGFLNRDQYENLNVAIVELKKMLAWLILKIENERLAG